MLMRTHYDFDPQRFLDPGTDPADGYAWFLGRQLKDVDVVIFVAELNGDVIGYVYAGLEPISWKDLRDACGFIHDVGVDEPARRAGTATALIEKAVEWLRDRGAPRVVLTTAEKNTGAQQLFARLGFRRTMIEMTREL
jgi:GNAT superfamily N-acetyltransferase